MDKRSLLDDVLTRFVPEKADQNLIRDLRWATTSANSQCKRSAS